MSSKSTSNNKKLIKACVESLAKSEQEPVKCASPEGPKPASKEDCLRKAAEKGQLDVSLLDISKSLLGKRKAESEENGPKAKIIVISLFDPKEETEYGVAALLNECLVLRSLQPLGLATNQRVRITNFYSNCVQVETLQDKRTVYIPRIRFNFNLRYGDSYRVLRTQLPLRLAYCMTYNKSQGQTLGRVLLDTTEEPFAHGHCYVALSRVRSKHDIRIFSSRDNVCTDTDGKKIAVITNVVYPQVLLQNVL